MSRHEGRTAAIVGAALGLGREYARGLAGEDEASIDLETCPGRD